MSDINEVMKKLLDDNAKRKDRLYREAYYDGALDVFNEMKKLGMFKELVEVANG